MNSSKTLATNRQAPHKLTKKNSSDSIVSECSDVQQTENKLFYIHGGDIETINLEFERLKTA